MVAKKKCVLFVMATRVVAATRGAGDEEVLLDWQLIDADTGRRVDKGMLDWPDFDVWVMRQLDVGTLTSEAIRKHLKKTLPKLRGEFGPRDIGKINIATQDRRK